MTFKIFTIVFDRDSKKFTPGESLDGKVVLQVKCNEKVRCVKIHFLGRECTYISCGEDSYNDERTFADETTYLLGNGNSDTRCLLEAGVVYEFPFSFQIPKDASPSLSHSKLNYKIEYVLKARVERPLALDYKVKDRVTVLTGGNTTVNYRMMEPVEVVQDAQVKKLLSEAGNLYWNVRLPSSVFFPGDVIPIRWFARNRSSGDIKGFLVKLVQIVDITACSHNDRVPQVVYEEKFTVYDESDTLQFVVPDTLESASFEGQLIKLRYVLAVQLCMKGICSNLNQTVPILIFRKDE